MVIPNAPGEVPSHEEHSPLAKRQVNLELAMKDAGGARFMDGIRVNKERKNETGSLPAKELMKYTLDALSVGVTLYLETCEKTRGASHCSVKVFEEVGADQVALITSKAIYNTLTVGVSALKVAVAIGKALIDELRFRKFREEAPGLFKWKMGNFKSNSDVHRARSLNAAIGFTKVNVANYEYPHTQIILIGTKALDLFIRHTGKVDVTTRKVHGKKNRDETVVLSNEATMQWVEDCIASNEFMTPIAMPTVIPPRPWTNNTDGGYHYWMAGKHSLMRGVNKIHQLMDLDNVEMPIVYKALNAIQATSWLVNTEVLEVIKRMQKLNMESAGLPASDPEPLPNKPYGLSECTTDESLLAWKAQGMNAVLLKQWSKAAGHVHDRNHERVHNRKRVLDIVKMADMMIREDTPFYFPHNLDFRGRAYAIPVYLQPQGDDISKGLLKFASALPLAVQDAADWLAVHGANCLAEYKGLKLDKLPRAERINWIYDHSDFIRDTAFDPFSNLWWTEADSPFCFLAFCFEWAGYCKDGLAHESSIPVAMDGSCNGLQHYSALLLDEVGGAAVNLVPSDIPQDIYRNVAEKINERLQLDAMKDGRDFSVASSDKILLTFPEGEPKVLLSNCVEFMKVSIRPSVPAMARQWLAWGKVNRSFCKRQVMTLPYGSEKFGFKQQISAYLHAMKKDDQPEFMRDKGDGYSQTMYMAGVTWDSLGEAVSSAQRGMAWFQALARICVKEELPITWIAPNGLPISQAYRELALQRINTTLNGVSYRPHHCTPTGKFNRIEQVNGIAPNIIHSLDASAMMFTTCAAQDEGISSFAMIHDSFGTHAAYAAKLATITREQFVFMYREHDILLNIEEALLANVDLTQAKPPVLPARPTKGNLDLDGVLQSKYFFS